MDQDATQLEELKARRDALRERLRAKCEQIVAAVEALPEPKTYLEAARAARMVIMVDKMVERVFSELKVVKDNVHSRSRIVLVDRAVNAPSVTDCAVTPPPPSFASAGEDDMAEDDETQLSKTYLKLEQIALKIADLDAEFNSTTSTKSDP